MRQQTTPSLSSIGLIGIRKKTKWTEITNKTPFDALDERKKAQTIVSVTRTTPSRNTLHPQHVLYWTSDERHALIGNESWCK